LSYGEGKKIRLYFCCKFDRAGNILQVLMDFQENPSAAQHHLKDPGVAMKIQKLINAGIVQTR
jgi:hypothetical protein